MTKASQESIELKFCDLCGRSIPQKEIDAGTSKTVSGKTVGACCLSPLLEGLGEVRAESKEAVGATRPAGMPLLFATTVVLVGVLGAAYYVDFRAHARDPAPAIRDLDGRLKVVEELMDGQERVLRNYGDGVVRDVMARVQPGMDRLETEFGKLRSELPKRDGGIEALKGRMTKFADQMGDLVARQAALESQLGKSLAAVREELGNVDRSLVELRRRSVALGTPAAAEPNRAAKAKEAESLPESLGRKVDQLGNEDPGVRWSAVDELIRSGDKRVVPYLLPMLKDADPFVRRLCAEGLGSVGDVAICNALITALEDKEAIVRESAYKSLVKLSGRRIAFDPEASDKARRGMVRKWRQWWDGRSKG